MEIAVDDPTTDEAMHASTRSLAAAPYNSLYEDVPFTFLEIVDVLRNTPKKYVTAVLVSLDFHGAFDSVWHPLVIPYFRERALPSGLYHLCTFLADRSVFVRSNAGQVEANPTLGSPQGSPLSRFSRILSSTALSLRMPRGVIVQAYADDTIILVPVPSRDALDILASEVLRRVIEWSRAAKVSLNCDKSFCVLFSHGVGPHGARTSHLVFDRRLSFFHHADYLRQKVALLASRVATFFAMQRSCVSPAHSVNVPTGDPPGSLTGVRCGGAKTTSAGRTLGVNARLPHGKHGSVAGLDACASNRPGANVSMPSSAFLLYAGILRSVPSDFGLLGWRMPMSTWRYTLRCLPRFLLCALQARGPVSLLALLPSTSTLMAPSQIPRLAQHVGRFRLTRTTSAYTTEVVAFHAALLHALTATYTLPLALYTDCLSLLQAFTSPCNAEQHVLTIRALLRRLSISVPLRVFHVPGHAGVFGNDVADFLAQRAASPHTARIEPQDAYRAASYGAILRCLRNRALLIGALRALNALPHVSRPLGLPTAHLYTEYVSESCEVGMARGPFRWGPRVLASLASQSSVCAISAGKLTTRCQAACTGPADHLLPCPPWLLHIARMFPPTLLTARSGPAAYHVPRFYLLLCNKAREGQPPLAQRMPVSPARSSPQDFGVANDCRFNERRRLDVGTRVQARAREIEEVLSRFCLDAGNRIPVNARHFIMARVFELVELCSDLGAGAASERGAVLALKDQLVETRGENTALLSEPSWPSPGPASCHRFLLPTTPQPRHSRHRNRTILPHCCSAPCRALLVSRPLGPPWPTFADAAERDVRSSNTSWTSRARGVCHALAPSTTPARDTLRLIKANIDPVEKDIKDVMFAPHPDYTSYSIADDSSAMIVTRKPPFDVVPVTRSKNVVAIYCEGPTFTFIFVSMYAPPHSPLENVLEELTTFYRWSRSPHVIVAGDFNSKHRLWDRQPPFLADAARRTVQAYADDTVILLPAATTAALSELTLEVLRRVRLWADSVKVSLNRDKTFCVLFHHGARGVARTRITVRPPGAQTALAFKDSIRILVWF
ncbi:hypothetical protein HPB52_022913 [Rhipicephalus sanguineus]|uniref:Reverse transcriptase domain-containing protein n=1 Tax=Rhipicephalus sanguineus TaxID=34632 RepID=A0A9D4Q362_RHISA|nr:hypothetical protein HPB52_022913 [Rhipicephalus sanguineus]